MTRSAPSSSSSRPEELDAWAVAIRPLSTCGVHTFSYFSNFFEGHAPASARALQERLGLSAVDPGALGAQIPLF